MIFAGAWAQTYRIYDKTAVCGKRQKDVFRAYCGSILVRLWKGFDILKAKGMKYFRLKKQADFQKLFKTGKRAFSASLTMIYRQAETLTMGISVGKRHGKSVKRNRIKRLIREAFRAENNALKENYRIVFIPKVSDEYSFQIFQRDIRWMLKKEKL